MEEPKNVVTSAIRNVPKFGGTKPDNFRDWYSKTRVVLSLSNQDVFDVLNGSAEPTPTLGSAYTLSVPTSGVNSTLEASMQEPIFDAVPRDDRPFSYTGSTMRRQDFGRRSRRRTESV